MPMVHIQTYCTWSRNDVHGLLLSGEEKYYYGLFKWHIRNKDQWKIPYVSFKYRTSGKPRIYETDTWYNGFKLWDRNCSMTQMILKISVIFILGLSRC